MTTAIDTPKARGIVAVLASLFPGRFPSPTQDVWTAKLVELSQHYTAEALERAAWTMSDEVQWRDLSWKTYRDFVHREAGVQSEAAAVAALPEPRHPTRRRDEEHQRGMVSIQDVLRGLGVVPGYDAEGNINEVGRRRQRAGARRKPAARKRGGADELH